MRCISSTLGYILVLMSKFGFKSFSSYTIPSLGKPLLFNCNIYVSKVAGFEQRTSNHEVSEPENGCIFSLKLAMWKPTCQFKYMISAVNLRKLAIYKSYKHISSSKNH